MAAARIVGIFTAVAVLFTGQVWLDYAYLRVPVSPLRALGLSAIDWYLWAALTPLVLALARRFPLARGRLPRALAVHVPASLAITALKLPVQEALGALLIGVARQPTSFLKIYVSLFTYWAIVGVAMAVRQYREARERELRAAALEAGLARAELDVLRMRLNPHFLFNTLNGVSALMHENVEAADQMLTRLGELLRMTLDRGSVQEVTLKDELDFVRRYLDIQQLRFGDRLAVTIEAQPATLALAVPSLSLQPLVENALKHGAEQTPGPASLAVTARIAAGALQIEVSDDGPGPGAGSREPGAGSREPGTGSEARGPGTGNGHEGTGLETTRRRLRHLYGDAASLALEPRSPRGAVARLTVPAREGPA